MNSVEETMESFRSLADTFKGDKAMFWSGRMSMMVRQVLHSTPKDLLFTLSVLERCTDEYDQIIEDRAGVAP